MVPMLAHSIYAQDLRWTRNPFQRRYLQLCGNEYATQENTHFQKMNIVCLLGPNPSIRNKFYWSASTCNESRSTDDKD